MLKTFVKIILLFGVVSMLILSCGKDTAQKQSKIRKNRLVQLKNYMAGTFTSATQAEVDTNYFDITLNMVPVWEKAEMGHWLYVEQSISSNLAKPYRQRVYHLTRTFPGKFLSKVYSLPEASRFIGASETDSIWQTIQPDSLTLLEGCGILLTWQDSLFVGSTHESDCANSWGDAAYATSEVTISETILKSWDRGWDTTGTQVWGAEGGGYVFVKE